MENPRAVFVYGRNEAGTMPEEEEEDDDDFPSSTDGCFSGVHPRETRTIAERAIQMRLLMVSSF